MPGERKDIRRRIAAVLRDELSDDGWEIFHYCLVIGEGQKYITIQTGATRYEFLDANFTAEILQVRVLAVTAYRTEGIESEIEDMHDDMIDEVRVALLSDLGNGDDSGQLLVSTDYPTPPSYLDYRIGGVTLVSDEGAVTRQESGTNQVSLVTEFVLEVPILTEVECSFP
jgi:hypothetical protein